MEQFSWGWILPSDDDCGYCGIWLSRIRGKVVSIGFFLAPRCGWLWGYEGVPEAGYWAVGLGPLFKITWSNW